VVISVFHANARTTRRTSGSTAVLADASAEHDQTRVDDAH
jgi:hypothetical protein